MNSSQQIVLSYKLLTEKFSRDLISNKIRLKIEVASEVG